MNQIIDFTNAEPGLRDYGGSDAKKSIIYNGEHYMLKFSEEKEKVNSLATSTSNSVFSEYVSSHIVATVGLPVHETLLGIYEDEPVVACKDFVQPGEKLQEFDWFLRNVYRKSEIGRVPTYNQIYGTINNTMLSVLKDEAIERYWDAFVMDALVGNFDRHKGNWGYLVNETKRTIALAPIYDCGSSLYPSLADMSFHRIIDSRDEINKRIFEFPKATLLKTDDIKHGEKFSYSELLNSNFDENCLASIAKIVPRVDLEKINKVIDETPLISEDRKLFYKTMVAERKEQLLDHALELHLERGDIVQNQEPIIEDTFFDIDDDMEGFDLGNDR